MSQRTVRLGVRQWDHLVPLALGDVPAAAGVHVERRESTPDLWTATDLDAAETSLSRYVRRRAAGDETVVALPVFLMRAFRHRCIIVRRESPATAPSDLAGLRIGLTGWPDSGNTWTRAILREAGVGVDDATWRVGRLTDAHPVEDRIGVSDPPVTVSALADDDTLVAALREDRLDAVMTPFMPPGFDLPGTDLRPLLPDTRAAEQDWFARHGFIPGIHVLAVRAAALADDPGLGQRLVDACDEAKTLSFARRRKLMDVTPWQNEALAASARAFGEDWMPYGWSHDRAMVAAFVDELVAQRLLDAPVALDTLFPLPLEPSRKDAA